jgi:hypothetical protein
MARKALSGLCCYPVRKVILGQHAMASRVHRGEAGRRATALKWRNEHAIGRHDMPMLSEADLDSHGNTEVLQELVLHKLHEFCIAQAT